MPKFRYPLLAVTLQAAFLSFASADETAPATITSPLGHPMSLKFSDEFNAVKDTDGQAYIDRSKWITTFWQGSSERTLTGNQEAQYYLDKDFGGRNNVPAAQRFNPFSFNKPGILTISARKVPKDLWPNYGMNEQRCFASGLLVSDKAFTFKYGYAEGRFKLPGNRGAWPAFWMLGNDPALGEAGKAHEWPPEIDIFEYMGHWDKKHSSAVIARKGPAEKVNDWTLKYNPQTVDISESFHTWGVEWNEKEVAFTFDGKVWLNGNTPPSLQRPMYLLINLAVGGKWYGEEISNITKKPTKPWEVDEATMPWKMECDYVRVYQP